MGRKVDRVAMVMVSIFFTQEDSGLQGLEWEYEHSRSWERMPIISDIPHPVGAIQKCAN